METLCPNSGFLWTSIAGIAINFSIERFYFSINSAMIIDAYIEIRHVFHSRLLSILLLFNLVHF